MRGFLRKNIDKIKEIWYNTLRKQQRRDIMPDFYLTKMGQKFYNVDVPKIAKSLERIADALEYQNGEEKRQMQALIQNGESAIDTAQRLAKVVLDQQEEIKRLKSICGIE
jgi:hypothetical protein